MDKLSYHRHRYPSLVIQQAIWLYFRFALSYRDVADMTIGVVDASISRIIAYLRSLAEI